MDIDGCCIITHHAESQMHRGRQRCTEHREDFGVDGVLEVGQSCTAAPVKLRFRPSGRFFVFVLGKRLN